MYILSGPTDFKTYNFNVTLPRSGHLCAFLGENIGVNERCQKQQQPLIQTVCTKLDSASSSTFLASLTPAEEQEANQRSHMNTIALLMKEYLDGGPVCQCKNMAW